jgi:hypothetical protein
MCGLYAGGITLYRSHAGTPEIWTCRGWCRMTCRRVRGVLADRGKAERHTARDCTAHAGLTVKELDEFEWWGDLLLCVPNRQMCLIAASIVSKITRIYLTSSGQQLRCCAGQTIQHKTLVQTIFADQPLCARLTVCYIAGLLQRSCSAPNSNCGLWKRITLLTCSNVWAICH